MLKLNIRVGYAMVMVGKLCHVFTKTGFVPSKHWVALDHIYQEITLKKLKKESDLLKVSVSLASVAVPVQSPKRESFLNTLINTMSAFTKI